MAHNASLPSDPPSAPDVPFRTAGASSPAAGAGGRRPQHRTGSAGSGRVTSAGARLQAAGVPTTWSGLARRLEAITAELEAMAGQLPAGEPSGAEGKELRSALGKFSTAVGGMKKSIPGLGVPGGA